MSQHSNEADELRALIGAIEFDTNTQISELTTIREQAKNLGAALLSLRTHNLDIASAAGELANNIPTAIEDVLTRYRLVVAALEDYRGIVS